VIVLQLADHVQTGRAVVVRATGPHLVNEEPTWVQQDAEFRDGIVTLTNNRGIVMMRWFLVQAGAPRLNAAEMGRIGSGPGAREERPFTRFE
jgi:hypothetical protein